MAIPRMQMAPVAIGRQSLLSPRSPVETALLSSAGAFALGGVVGAAGRALGEAFWRFTAWGAKRPPA